MFSRKEVEREAQFLLWLLLDGFFLSEKGKNRLLLYLDREGGEGQSSIDMFPLPDLDLWYCSIMYAV